MKKIIAGLAILLFVLSACVKKVDPVDSNNATVTLTDNGAKYVTDNITVNPKDSLYFSFTITSPKDMRYVSIQKNPVNQTAFLVRDTVTATAKNSYSTTKRFLADSANGSYIYRIVAHDAGGNYIGHKDIVITVNADFYFYTARVLQVPDTTAKTNNCYLSATTGEVFSYTTGAANSAKIDFGVMWDTTGRATASTTDDLKFSLYALSATQPQIPFYDLASFATKNATTMKKATSPTFASLTSSAGLRAAATTNLASGATSKVTQLLAGNLVFFRTASGKVGCLQVTYANDNGTYPDSYLNVDVKIER